MDTPDHTGHPGQRLQHATRHVGGLFARWASYASVPVLIVTSGHPGGGLDAVHPHHLGHLGADGNGDGIADPNQIDEPR